METEQKKWSNFQSTKADNKGKAGGDDNDDAKYASKENTFSRSFRTRVIKMRKSGSEKKQQETIYRLPTSATNSEDQP